MSPSTDARFRLSVVVVEDEALLLMDAAEALTEAGFEVLTAANAAEALALLQSQADAVRVLFTDIQMPGSMDGLELAHLARSHWPWIKLLVTSGRWTPEAGELPPGSRFVPKPYSPDRVVAALRELTSEE
jgi:CheY-like chemotaxis protein